MKFACCFEQLVVCGDSHPFAFWKWVRSLRHTLWAQCKTGCYPNYIRNSHPLNRSSALIVISCPATSLGTRLFEACPQNKTGGKYAKVLVFQHLFSLSRTGRYSDTLHQQNFHPNKMCLRRHSTYLLACFVSCLWFPLASRPSNCRKALDQIFKVCRTALLQRSESRRLEAFKDNHANVSISLGVGENCCMKFWGGPFDMYIYIYQENENGSEWTPGILFYKHPFSQPTWFCKDKLCTKRFCSMQKNFRSRLFNEQPFVPRTSRRHRTAFSREYLPPYHQTVFAHKQPSQPFAAKLVLLINIATPW